MGAIRTNDLLVLMDREEHLLTADNWHSSAVVMMQAAERLRVLAARLRAHGLSAEDAEVDDGR